MAPAPVGPYSQAVAANGMLYISGQIPIDQNQGGIIISGSIEEETNQVMPSLVNVKDSNYIQLQGRMVAEAANQELTIVQT